VDVDLCTAIIIITIAPIDVRPFVISAALPGATSESSG
jgi:hypothetical protein